MQPTLNQDQQILLETIAAHDGKWNWYQVFRRCIGQVSSPSQMDLSPLIQRGLIEQRPVPGEPLPRLHITRSGKKLLSQGIMNRPPDRQGP